MSILQLLTEEVRDEMVFLLTLRTGWNEQVFTKMSDEELTKIYNERVANK